MTEAVNEQLFDLTLTDEQRMNRETMQRFAAAELRDQGRQVDNGESAAANVYPATAELGLTLLQIPEALGGAGMTRSPVSNALILVDVETAPPFSLFSAPTSFPCPLLSAES